MFLQTGQRLAAWLAELRIGQFLFRLRPHRGDGLTQGGIGRLLLRAAKIGHFLTKRDDFPPQVLD
jgi:hypothetical protein